MKRALNKNQAAAATVIIFLLLIIAIVASFYFGSVYISPERLFSSEIFWQIRFPRIILAALVGSMLALSGVVLQGVLRNPLADPYILGVSSGGAIGAAPRAARRRYFTGGTGARGAGGGSFRPETSRAVTNGGANL